MARFEKSKRYKAWIGLVLFMLTGMAGRAETPAVRAKFSADSVLIGDQFRLERVLWTRSKATDDG